MREAEIEDVTHYRTLSQLFQRRLKDNARTIDNHHPLVSVLQTCYQARMWSEYVKFKLMIDLIMWYIRDLSVIYHICLLYTSDAADE